MRKSLLVILIILAPLLGGCFYYPYGYGPGYGGYGDYGYRGYSGYGYGPGYYAPRYYRPGYYGPYNAYPEYRGYR